MEAKCPAKVEDVGTCVVILKMAKESDNRAQLLVQGISRIKIIEFLEGKPYLQARIEVIEDSEVKDIEVEALMANLVSLFDRVVKLSPFMPQEYVIMAKSITDAGTLSDMIASIINASPEEKHRILQTIDVKERLTEVTRLINHQVEILELGSKIQSQVKSDMDKVQREYYLRQQLKAIKQELGETEEGNVEVEEYRKKIENKMIKLKFLENVPEFIGENMQKYGPFEPGNEAEIPPIVANILLEKKNATFV